jgi:hypothetical protein
MASVHLQNDRLWGEPCLGYSVQAHFDAESTSRLAELQTRTFRGCAARLHLPPPQTLHVSVFSLVPVRWPDEGKEELWKRLIAAGVKDIALQRLGESFSIEFEEVRVTESAIILCTQIQPAPIQDLRQDLNRLVGTLGLPTQAFDRTHVTIARPSEDQLLATDTVTDLECTPARLRVRVHKMCLIRELVYPSLQFESLA